MKKTLPDFQTDWKKLVDKAMTNYKSLSAAERIWFTIESLIGQVDNGGIISHYYNHGADYNQETIDDLTALGFADLAELLKKVNALFPKGQPSLHIDERNTIIENWPEGKYDDFLDAIDQQFYRREEELVNRLVQHIETNVLIG